MLNKKVISLENHLKFVENLDKNRIYLKIDDLGVINFKISKDYVELGLHKNPYKNRVGSKLLETAIEYAFEELKAKKIILYVFENNIKAISLYKKFGFNEVDKQKNIIKMELKKLKMKSVK